MYGDAWDEGIENGLPLREVFLMSDQEAAELRRLARIQADAARAERAEAASHREVGFLGLCCGRVRSSGRGLCCVTGVITRSRAHTEPAVSPWHRACRAQIEAGQAGHRWWAWVWAIRAAAARLSPSRHRRVHISPTTLGARAHYCVRQLWAAGWLAEAPHRRANCPSCPVIVVCISPAAFWGGRRQCVRHQVRRRRRGRRSGTSTGAQV